MVMRGWLIIALAFFVVPVLSTVFVDSSATLTAQGVDEETEKLYDEAIDLFKRGKDTEALQKLKEVLARDPSQEEAYRLRNKVAFAVWIDLMIKRGEIKSVVNTFLNMAKLGERKKRQDQEAVTKLLEQIRTGDYGVKRKAVSTLERDHGDFAVPTIVPVLAETSNDEYRTELLQLLVQMGPEVTLPLIECLGSDDPALNRYICIVLGQIKDDRAAGALKGIMQSAKEEALIKAADSAWRGLGLVEAMATKSAEALFTDVAAKYYRRSPAVMKEFSANRVIWEWSDGKLTKFDVPLNLYHYYVAEANCYKALAVDPNYQPAHIWLARVHLAQSQELHATAQRGSDEARVLAEKMAKADFLATSSGIDNLEEAVRACIQDKDLAVAEAGIFTLGKLLTGRTFQGGVLAEALTSQFKVVRYAAAIAIGNLVPSSGFANDGAVTAELSRCTAESTMRSILVVDDNMETRNQLLSELRDLGYSATGAHNGETGILLAKRPPTPDLVILKTTLGDADTSLSTQNVINEIKRDVRTKDMPILGLASEGRAEADKDLYGDKLAGMVKIPLVKDAYAGTLKDAFGDRSAGQAKALMFAEKAAKALAKLAATPGSLDPSGALGDLIGTLSDKPDNVKLPAIAALGSIGNAEAVNPLKDLLANESASAEVRAAAAMAIGQICRASGSIEVDVYKALLMGLGSSDLTVSRGAGIGLGVAPLTPAQHAEVAQQHRISLKQIFEE